MIKGEKEFALFHYKIHKFYHLTSNAIFPQDFLMSLIPLISQQVSEGPRCNRCSRCMSGATTPLNSQIQHLQTHPFGYF